MSPELKPGDPGYLEAVEEILGPVCSPEELRQRRDLARDALAPSVPRWTVSAYLEREGKYLLVLHKRLQTWLPVGGGIEPGERPAEAVVREIHEETGIRALGTPEVLGYDEYDGLGRIHMNLAFKVSVTDPTAEPVSDGSWDKFEWVDPDKAYLRYACPENVSSTIEGLAEARRVSERYKDLWDRACAQIAAMCEIAGADPSLPPDAWTLRDAIVALKARAERP